MKTKTNQCKSCQACKRNPELRERYYKAWFERKGGDGSETLEMIGREIGISNNAIYNHAHKHMERRPEHDPAKISRQKKLAVLRKAAMKELEFDATSMFIPKEDYEQAIDDILIEGLAQLKLGDKQITVNQILAAAKIKGDWKSKKRGQDTEIMKMMYRGASGFTQKPPQLGLPGQD